jgi:hypothetical protein
MVWNDAFWCREIMWLCNKQALCECVLWFTCRSRWLHNYWCFFNTCTSRHVVLQPLKFNVGNVVWEPALWQTQQKVKKSTQAWKGRGWGPQNFYTITAWSWQGCQPCAQAAFTTQQINLVFISVQRLSHNTAGGIKSMKNLNDPTANGKGFLPALQTQRCKQILRNVLEYRNLLDFRFSPCSETCMFSFGYFPASD